MEWLGDQDSNQRSRGRKRLIFLYFSGAHVRAQMKMF